MSLRKLVNIATALPIMAFGSVVASSSVSAEYDPYWYRTTYFSDASKTTIVGYVDGYCSGNTTSSGATTTFYNRRFFTTCP
jgi:hypothetical protein